MIDRSFEMYIIMIDKENPKYGYRTIEKNEITRKKKFNEWNFDEILMGVLIRSGGANEQNQFCCNAFFFGGKILSVNIINLFYL